MRVQTAGKIALPCLVAVACMSAAQAGSSARISRTFEKFGPQVVPVYFELRLATAPDGGPGNKVEGTACGVIIDADGLVLTTADPFPDPGGNPRQTFVPDRFFILDPEGKKHLAHAVGLDRDLNLAFLRLDRPAAFPARPVRFVRRPPRSGEEVLLIGLLGEPYGYAPTFTLAHIVGKVEKPRPLFVLDTLVQDLTIGGLVVTTRGEALGMIGEDVIAGAPTTAASMAASGNVLSLFASISQGQRAGYPMLFPYHGLLDERIANPPPLDTDEWNNRGWLGIIMQPLDEELSDYWHVPGPGGVVIGAVLDGSPAERAGLQVGDVILEIDHAKVRVREIRDLIGFRDQVQSVGVGEEVPIEIFRAGQKESIALILGKPPKTAFLAEEREDESFGLTVKELTFDFLQAMNMSADTRGVYISAVENAGWADIGGLSMNDVVRKINGRAVESLAAFDEVMAAVTRDQQKDVLFFLMRRVRTMFVAVKTNWQPSGD